MSVGSVAKAPVTSWSSGLCGCFDDISGCCLTFWCPCVTVGRIAEIVDQGNTSCCASGLVYTLPASATGLGFLYTCTYRSKLRGQYGLVEEPCGVHCFCEACALCQEYRELKNQGFDMAIGWDGNVERKRNGAATAAPQMNMEMTR